MVLLAVALVAVLLCAQCKAQVDGVRLTNSSLGKHAGIVEVLHNGTWGTICHVGWSSSDARVVCRMLGYSNSRCAVRGAPDAFGVGSGPVWFSNLYCSYYHQTLNDCTHSGFGTNNTCDHSQDAAVICQDDSVVPVPNITSAESISTRSVSLNWMISRIPPLIRAISFRIYYRAAGSYTRSTTYRTPVSQNSSLEYSYTISSRITRNTTYTIYMRAEGEYTWCYYNDLLGENSDSVQVTTLAVAPLSNIPMRLVSPDPSLLSFAGRFEVYHDGQWGSVCDDYFGQDEADIACFGLNYTDGALCYATSGFSQGSGPILLDNLDCSGKDRLDDCTHLGWGEGNCRRYDEVGVVCRSNANDTVPALPLPANFTANDITTSSITLAWEPFTSGIRLQLQIRYNTESSYPFTRTVQSGSSTYKLYNLQFGSNYSIQIRTYLSLRSSFRGNCYSSLYGDYTEPIHVETSEEAPTAAPDNFHVSILNSTALEASWRLPQRTKLNGIVRGFKVFVRKVGEPKENAIDVEESVRAYIIGRLEPNTAYTISMLVYTIADGPRSVRLTVVTPAIGTFVTISQFGINGDNLEVVRKTRYSRGVNVLCASSVQNSTVGWQFSNGNRVGHSNINLREASYPNGTAVLQIGSATQPPRYLQECDGGVYTCVVVSPSGARHERNFTLLFGYSVPAPSAPYLVSKGPTWAQVGWDKGCDAGYQVNSYRLVMSQTPRFYYYYTVATTTETVYTVKNLLPNMQYRFKLYGLSDYSGGSSSNSPYITITTLPAGPSPPRNVTVTVTSSPQVLLTWNPPASPTGVVFLYAAYASTDLLEEYYSGVDLPAGTASKLFHVNEGNSGTMEVNVTAQTYKFQMSTLSYVGGELVEGDLSLVGPESIVFVPMPGLPEVSNLAIDSVTNTSIKLSWNYPLHLEEAILAFKVTYSGEVEWTSPSGLFVHFTDSNELTTTSTSVTISPLVPSTNYFIKVSVVTVEGQGGQAMESSETSSESGDKLAYFQLRIQSIKSCLHWPDEEKLSQLKAYAASTLQSLCNCGVTADHISQGEFSCRGGLAEEIVYRARVSGTETRSGSDLVALLDQWVKSEHASVEVDQFRHHVDSGCDTVLDNIHAPDCPLTDTPTTQPDTPTTPPSDTPTLPSDTPTTAPSPDTPTTLPPDDTTSPPPPPPSTSPPGAVTPGSQVGMSSAAVGGLTFGAFAIGLVLALAIGAALVAAYLILKKKKSNQPLPKGFSELENAPSNRSSVALEEKTEQL